MEARTTLATRTAYDARSCYCKGLPYAHTYMDCEHLWRDEERPIPVRKSRVTGETVPTAATMARKLATLVRARAVARRRLANAERDTRKAMLAYERACARHARATDAHETLDTLVRELARALADMP